MTVTATKILTPLPQIIPCLHCAKFGICYTSGLNKEEIALVEQEVKHLKTLKKGEYLIRHGAPFVNIYAVHCGALKTFTVDNKGKEHIANFFLSGDLLGFGAIIDKKYHYSAVALEETCVCEINFDKLFQLAVKIPALQRHLFNLMSLKLNQSNNIYFDSDAAQRMASFLLSVSNRKKRYGFSATEFSLSMPRQDIASYLGLAAETVSRLFAELKENNIAIANRRKVEILDLLALQKIAGVCTV
ncbi:MAG: helix-turn-helix domain-containing protein [Gammaproteobacteria bacterium]|nr:helix-turn-helix domain-containing protein [Gammaproteobacteria bacterium]